MTVRIDLLEKRERKCRLSRIDRLYAMPVTTLNSDLPDDPGLVYRSRGTRGGGHSIVCSDGSVFACNFETRTDAERAIATCYETQVFIPPAGKEPTEKFVSRNAKAYQPKV